MRQARRHAYMAIMLLTVCLCAGCASQPRSRGPTRPIDVWLDVDTTNGLVDTRPRDVDDGLAVLFALHSPELSVRGVSVCFGNGRLDQCLPIAQDLLSRFAPQSLKHPYAGAASADDLGKETEATRALAQELSRRPLVILALGPMTNVATVVRNHPELRANIREIVVVAGRRPGFGFHAPGRPDLIFPDANFEKDAPAMQVLLDSDLPIVFAGYEVSSDVWVTRADLERLKSQNSIGKWIAETSEAWVTRWEQTMKLRGFNPFDTLAVGRVIDPTLLESVPVTARIESRIDERASAAEQAAGKQKPYLICDPASGKSKLIYCTAAKDRFTPLLMQRLAASPRSVS